MSLTREDFVTQSVDQFLRTRLFDMHGYPPEKITIVERFDVGEFSAKPTPLDQNYIATGFNFDNGGRQAELGSTLKERKYTIEFFVIGMDFTWAKNLANAIKFMLEEEGDLIPLLDVTESDPEKRAQIDTLVVDAVSAEHQAVADPQPWQENIWLTTLRVLDVYYDRFA